MKKKLIFPIMVATLATFVNCNKEYNPGSAPDETPGNYTLSTVSAELAVKSKTVKIDAATGGTFRGNSGTRFEFPPSAFVTSAGLPVTGEVTVTVAEYLNKSDMLFSGVLPISGGEPLLSGGEVMVDVQQGGQALNMAPGKAFRANMPMKGVDPAGMGLFTGARGDSGVVWKPVDSGTATGNFIFDIGDTIGLSSRFTGYANADRFMSSPNYQNFKIVVNTGGLSFSRDSFKITTFYDDYNGVWPNYDWSGTGNVYGESHVPDIAVHFVVFGIINGNYYGGTLGAKPANGNSYTVNVTKTTPAAFKAVLDAL